MPLMLELTAQTPGELEMQIIELAKSLMGRDDAKSVDQLIDELRAKLAPQGLDLRVLAKAPTKAEAPTEKPAPEATPEDEPEVQQAKKKRGGQPKLSKDDAADDLNAETPAARKARCVAKLQDLFANGHKAEVLKILAEHGGGAKTFAAVDEGKFELISDALEAL